MDLIPFLKIFNETAKSVDQGGGKRKGSFAVYLEPWHADIEQFLELRKNTGAEEFRARDFFMRFGYLIFYEKSGRRWRLDFNE